MQAGLLFYGQSGTITNIEILPVAPTTNDSVYLVGHFSFSSGGCEKQFFNASSSGTDVTAAAQYCLGALTVICDASDTVNLGILPAGNYNVDLTLSSGSGPTPCTPGIVPDDSDTASFTVTSPTLISEHTETFRLFPNPAIDVLFIHSTNNELKAGSIIEFYSIAGTLTRTFYYQPAQPIDLSGLSAGTYLVRFGKHVQRLMLY